MGQNRGRYPLGYCGDTDLPKGKLGDIVYGGVEDLDETLVQR